MLLPRVCLPLLMLAPLAATANARLESDHPFALLGSSVASAGDVNGDGYDDVIVGAPEYAVGPTRGAAFVFLGGPTGVPASGAAGAHAHLQSDSSTGGFGDAVASAGDVDGDGYDDVIVGAPDYTAGESLEGAAFLFLGSATGIASIDASGADARLEADQANTDFGASASGCDVNQDGYDDVIVGAPYYDSGQVNEGAAFVFLGSAAGLASAGAASAHARLEADQGSARFGRSVDCAGDVDGDGYEDVIVGASGYDSPEFGEGAAFVFHGGAGGVANGSPATADAQLESNDRSAELGWRVASAGDVNGDGYDDVIVGAPYYGVSGGSNGFGAAFVFLGGEGGVGHGSPATAHARLESDLDTGGFFGFVADGIGDANGDGYDDVLVGTHAYDVDESDESNIQSFGAVFVFHGSAAGVATATAAQAARAIHTDQASAEFGWSAAAAGDGNGNGYADAIVGAPKYDAGESDEGAAFLVLPAPGGQASLIAGLALLIALRRRDLPRRF